MDHDRIAYLRANSAAWRLLRADSAALVLTALGQIFVVDNVRAIAESALLSRVDEVLYQVNRSLDPGGDQPAYPRTAREYVQSWAAPDVGWLRTFYPEDSTEAHYDATSELEKAYAWVTGLQARSFVGTESRLHTVIDLLRQMVHGADADPTSRLAVLHRRRGELDAEIEAVESGRTPPLDAAALRDRYQHFATTARELLADFREVEENFRALDRGAREKIAAWDGGKGELLEQLVGDRHAITASDQGRSFQAFHDFLLSRSQQEELTELLEGLVALDQVEVDRRLRHVHHDWLDAAERTQHMVRLLSEQLRRFLDDKVWLENRRVMDLLRSVERHALSLRSTARPAIEMELDALGAQLRLPMERPLYAPSAAEAFDSVAMGVPEDAPDVDTAGLFDQVYVDTTRLLATARRALRGRDQVGLTELLRDNPPELGLAEIIGYLALTEDDIDLVVDESVTAEVGYVDVGGVTRTLRMPQVTLVRRGAAAARRSR